jgi:hypothetical protein
VCGCDFAIRCSERERGAVSAGDDQRLLGVGHHRVRQARLAEFGESSAMTRSDRQRHRAAVSRIPQGLLPVRAPAGAAEARHRSRPRRRARRLERSQAAAAGGEDYCNNIFYRLRDTCPLNSRPLWRRSRALRTACRGGDSRGPRAGHRGQGLGRGRPVRGKCRARRQSALEKRS